MNAGMTVDNPRGGGGGGGGGEGTIFIGPYREAMPERGAFFRL